MEDIVLIGGGVRKDGPAYFNANFEEHVNMRVTLDSSPVKCVEADIRCNLVRILDPKGKQRWMLGSEVVDTTILRGFVEITE